MDYPNNFDYFNNDREKLIYNLKFNNNNNHSIIKRELPSKPSRSTSFNGFINNYYQNYNNCHEVCSSSLNHHQSQYTPEYYYDSFEINCNYTQPRESMATALVDECPPTSNNDGDYSTVLREKLTNDKIEIMNNGNNDSWLCDVDLFREKLKSQHFSAINSSSYNENYNGNFRKQQQQEFSAKFHNDYTYNSTIEQNCSKNYEKEKSSSSNSKNHIRSESESREYRSDCIPVNKKFQGDYPRNSNTRKILPPTPPSKSRSQIKNLRNSAAPPKVLIYNNMSPRRLQKVSRLQSASPPRINRRRSSDRYVEERIEFSNGKNWRKAKSATPPPKEQTNLICETTLPPSEPKMTETSVDALQSRNAIKEFFDDEVDSLEDDDDFGGISENDDYESSTDSEDGYKKHAYLIDSPDSAQNLSTNNINAGNIALLRVPDSFLAVSLFPNVPPYLSFATNSEKGPEVPQEIHKILKWRMTNIMPKVVRHTLVNSGHRLLKKTNDWIGTWGKHIKSPCFKTIRSYQKFNHLPGSFKIGRKDSCWKNLQKQVIKYGKKEFGFMPKTYIIPQDLKILRKTWPKYAQRNVKWIIKPPAAARGTGIRVVNQWCQIPKRKPLIVQRYIERPLLINGSKFDLRLYVLVTSINPLRVYIYKNGLARFASVKYSEKSETLNDRCMHLTNYSINKFSTNYVQPKAGSENVDSYHAHKWTLQSLWQYLKERHIKTEALWSTMRNLVLRTILAGENGINSMIKLNVESKYNCFELFGFDILLDAELIPWLLEVNISPSLHSDVLLDEQVKAPLIQAVLNTALYHIPPKLSADKQKEICKQQGIKGPLCYDKRMYITYLSNIEKIKHQQYIKKDREEYLEAILENLTPDDVRCLILSEDELERSQPLERIFPTNKSYKLLKFMETPRYYNRLLDAWETKFADNRSEGIDLLRKLCEEKLHLDVSAPPIRRDSNDNSKSINSENNQSLSSSISSTTTVSTTISSATTTTNKSSNKTCTSNSHQYHKETNGNQFNSEETEVQRDQCPKRKYPKRIRKGRIVFDDGRKTTEEK